MKAYIHAHTYMQYTHACIYMYIYTHTYIPTYLPTYIHTYTHAHRYIQICTRIQLCKCVTNPEILIVA